MVCAEGQKRTTVIWSAKIYINLYGEEGERREPNQQIPASRIDESCLGIALAQQVFIRQSDANPIQVNEGKKHGGGVGGNAHLKK